MVDELSHRLANLGLLLDVPFKGQSKESGPSNIRAASRGSHLDPTAPRTVRTQPHPVTPEPSCRRTSDFSRNPSYLPLPGLGPCIGSQMKPVQIVLKTWRRFGGQGPVVSPSFLHRPSSFSTSRSLVCQTDFHVAHKLILPYLTPNLLHIDQHMHAHARAHTHTHTPLQTGPNVGMTSNQKSSPKGIPADLIFLMSGER